MQTDSIKNALENLGQSYIFADLDNSLMFGDKSTGEITAEALHTICKDTKGKPASFVNDKQLRFLRCILAMGELVPTTARSTRSFNLVDLNHRGYAIVSHGSIILTPEGTPEPRWLQRTQTLAEPERENFNLILKSLKEHGDSLGIEANERIVSDYDLPIFLKASVPKQSGVNLSALLNRLEEELPLPGWRFSDHEYYIEIVPPYSRKELAVQWFLDEIADKNRSFTVAIGDMLTDLAFAGLCDYLLTPSNSQIVWTLFDRKS
jgi:hypothetical protein